jgi:hypothetical protein
MFVAERNKKSMIRLSTTAASTHEVASLVIGNRRQSGRKTNSGRQANKKMFLTVSAALKIRTGLALDLLEISKTDVCSVSACTCLCSQRKQVRRTLFFAQPSHLQLDPDVIHIITMITHTKQSHKVSFGNRCAIMDDDDDDHEGNGDEGRDKE